MPDALSRTKCTQFRMQLDPWGSSDEVAAGFSRGPIHWMKQRGRKAAPMPKERARTSKTVPQTLPSTPSYSQACTPPYILGQNVKILNVTLI